MADSDLYAFSMDKLSGRYRVNKDLSTSIDSVMRIQRIPWLVRKVVLNAPASASSMLFQHYLAEDGKEHVDTLQGMTGMPLAKHKINRVVDDKAKITVFSDPFAGPIRLSCWWGGLEDTHINGEQNDYLREAWEGSAEGTKLLLTIYSSVDYGWTVFEVTTVQEIDGQKRLATYSVVTATEPKHEVVHSRVVYDPMRA
ncbi:hypothetical protein BDZ89DRAFT_1128658 [Hymenopellis radicata]|nr:hypothetical protein BDZ89DRAFT_1128658 [Hymenopellis radicata]